MSNTWQISASSRTLRQLSGDLFGYFYNRIKHSEDARDLVAQTWIGAGKNYRRLSSLRYFVFRVAHNVLIGHWRRQFRQPTLNSTDFEQHPSPDPGPESALMIARWGHRMDDALQVVPVPFRAVVELWLRGLSRREIAEQLDMNPNIVRSRLGRGRKYLLAALSRGTLGILTFTLACADPDTISLDRPSPARTAEPDEVTKVREAESPAVDLLLLDPIALERLWSSPEDPPAGNLGGATGDLAGQHYLTGNERHLEVFAERLGQARGGGYLGIGADQAYLLLAWADPDIAWLADYDANVVAIHRVHLSFLRLAETPEAFFELWCREGVARALGRIAEDPHASLGGAEEREWLSALYRENLRIIHNRLEQLRGMTTANYLNDQQLYDRVRKLALADRMRPIVADLRGEIGLHGIAEVARELGVELRVLYLSNAEEYWADYGPQYRLNIEGLPWANDAIVLRTLLTWSRNLDYAYNIQPVENYRAWLSRPWVVFVYQVVHRPVKPALKRGEIDVFETTRDPSESPADRHWRLTEPLPATPARSIRGTFHG